MPWNEAWVLDIRDIRGHVFGCIRGQTTIVYSGTDHDL